MASSFQSIRDPSCSATLKVTLADGSTRIKQTIDAIDPEPWLFRIPVASLWQVGRDQCRQRKPGAAGCCWATGGKAPRASRRVQSPCPFNDMTGDFAARATPKHLAASGGLRKPEKNYGRWPVQRSTDKGSKLMVTLLALGMGRLQHCKLTYGTKIRACR